MQSDTLEERYAIKFCFRLGKNATEKYRMLQTAFRSSYMNRASVFEWHKKFKEARERGRDDERCGRSKDVNTLELIGQRVRVSFLVFELPTPRQQAPTNQPDHQKKSGWIVSFPLCGSFKYSICTERIDK